MPICEADPWRVQFFRDHACPDDVFIPTEDSDAWTWYPAQRWVYDKVLVALSQGLPAGPHGTRPPAFPIFSKPIVNLRGMGKGSRRIDSAADYQGSITPGHMWMPLLEGPHISSDAAVIAGQPCWWRHATGAPSRDGMFDLWTVHAEADEALEFAGGAWISRHLPGYTGMVNIETIGGVLIEVHLRFSDQWPDLYGAGWVEALIGLYRDRQWHFADDDRQAGYSMPLFGPAGHRYRHPPADIARQILAVQGISSLQICFHEDRPPESHAMPPGGFRLAIVNGWDLAAIRAAHDRLAAVFAAQTPSG